MRDLNLAPFALVIGMISIMLMIFGQGLENRSLKKEISSHIEYEIALNMLVHECWQADSVTFDEKVRTTDAFAKVDSLREGYWEDVFFQW